jgi:hypothetical protein
VDAGACFVRFVFAALAAWRVSFLLVREDGPGRVLAEWRERRTGVLRELLGCVKCTGMWVALPFAWFVGGGLMQFVVTWLAIAGVVALIDETTRPPFEWREAKDE